MRVPAVVPSLILTLVIAFPSSARQASEVPRLEPFIGWWSGQGRLGFRGGKIEVIRCRATYRPLEEANGLRQRIRCATTSGTVEIAARVRLIGRKLVGQWRERKYEFEGELDGKAIPNGFRVNVSGARINANMTVIVKQDRQVVEVQFLRGTLIGLTVLLRRGKPR